MKACTKPLKLLKGGKNQSKKKKRMTWKNLFFKVKLEMKSNPHNFNVSLKERSGTPKVRSSEKTWYMRNQHL